LASAIASKIVIKRSHSSERTYAIGETVSAAAVIGVSGGFGIYGSVTSREVGLYAIGGAGVFINSPFASGGIEFTFVAGTPVDFSGPYVAAGLSAGGITRPFGVIGAGFSLLFSPTLPLRVPIELTLMGFSVNVSISTPTVWPVTVQVEVTDTVITGIKFR
jgi:hypothetical protein